MRSYFSNFVPFLLSGNSISGGSARGKQGSRRVAKIARCIRRRRASPELGAGREGAQGGLRGLAGRPGGGGSLWIAVDHGGSPRIAVDRPGSPRIAVDRRGSPRIAAARAGPRGGPGAAGAAVYSGGRCRPAPRTRSFASIQYSLCLFILQHLWLSPWVSEELHWGLVYLITGDKLGAPGALSAGCPQPAAAPGAVRFNSFLAGQFSAREKTAALPSHLAHPVTAGALETRQDCFKGRWIGVIA